jgi:hypothetical protein
MKLKRVFAIWLAAFLVTSTLLVVSVSMVSGDPVFKKVLGIVDPNSGTLVPAYDAGPDNGWTYYYIQNRTNEGNGTDPITQFMGSDIYDPEIYINITDWMVGDECINVVSRNYGTYGVDHAGYVAFMNTTLTPVVGTDVAPTTELLKIPTPTIDVSGIGFINISWPALADPYGLIAGYTVYSSPTNGTTSGDAEWGIPSGGSVNAPITDLFFNDTGVIGGDDYYYSLKVVFKGWEFDNPANVDNYECTHFGEGSLLVTAPVSLLTVDFIVVEYFDTTPVGTINLDVGQSTVTVYAQGYNDTGVITWVGAVEADWTVALLALGSCSPTPSTSTVFTANFIGGLAVVTATNGSMTDIFNVSIAAPVIDYIILEHANGTEIPDMVFNMSGSPLDIWAAGYNNTGATFIGYQIVTWENITISGTGTFNVSSGDTASYTGMTTGFVEVRGTYAPGVFDSFTLLNEWGIPPVIDEIRITYGNGTVIPSLTLDILQQYEVFAWGYNLSSGAPIDQVEAIWQVGPGGSIDITPGLSTNFTAGTAGATVIVNATYGILPMAELTITINAPTVDIINITDSADGLDLVSELISTMGSVTAFASGYNLTGTTYTFVGLQTVTWSTNVTSAIGSLSQTSGTSTVFTGSAAGMALVTADDGLGHTDDFTIEIRVFTLDYIELTDAEDGTPLGDTYLDVGGEITVYASGYNDSTGVPIYTGLEDVTWTQSPNTIGSFNNATGTSSLFTAGMAEGTTTITGANAILDVTDSVDFFVNAPTLDSIEIRNATDGGGDAITSDEFTLGETRLIQSYYCAGYNDTALFIGDIDTAAWTLDTAIGTVIPVAGTFTQFTATTEGTGILMANVSGITDSITITVNPLDDTTPPATPTGLTVAVGTAEKTLELTWDVNTDDAIGYNVYRSDSATGTFTKLNSALLTDTSYTDSGLEFDTEYFYKISAVDNATNESPQSTTVSGTTAAETPDDGDGDDDDGGVPWILLLIPIIIVVVLLLMYLMMKKKKPEEEAAPVEEKKELPPPPGAKAEPEVEEAEEVTAEEELPPPEDEPKPAEDEGETKPPDDEEKPPEEVTPAE